MDVLDRACREREVAEQPVRAELFRSDVLVPEALRDRLMVLEADHVLLRGHACRRVRSPCSLRLRQVQCDAGCEQPILGSSQPGQVRRTDDACRDERLERRRQSAPRRGRPPARRPS